MADIQAFCKRYGYEQLNSVQKEAIQCVYGAGLLFSVPGSGKTTVIIARAGFMTHECGIDPEKQLIITFTKAAAEEMRKRYHTGFPEDEKTPDFRTIHSFCYKMIRDMAREVGARVPEITENTYRIVEKIMRDSGFFPEKELIDSVVSKISEAKNRMLDTKAIRDIEIDDLPDGLEFDVIYTRYKEYLRGNGMMDRDDLLVYAKGLMNKYPDLLKKLQIRYPYVSVDEAQDTSPLQHRIIDHFCSMHGNIFMVGDDDQSIYGFRGADPDELLRFGERWPNAKQLTMNINYRSDQTIVERARDFIEHNEHRAQKDMRAESRHKGTVCFPTAGNYYEQITYLIRQARAARENGESLAVLYRQNVSGFAIRYAFAREGIGYSLMPAGSPITGEKTVRDTIKLLAYASDLNNIEKFLNCYSCLGLYLSSADASEAKRLHYRYPDADILEVLSKTKTGREAQLMLTRNNQLRQLTEMNTLCVLNTLVADINPAMIKNANAKVVYEFLKYVARDHDELDAFVEALRRTDEEPRMKDPDVVITTLHSCKGLEFDRVIMIDLIEDLIPGTSDIERRLKLCTTREEKKKLMDEEDRRVEEEARLFYVGATRARHDLQMLIRKGKDADLSQLLIDYRSKDAPADTGLYAGSESGLPKIGVVNVPRATPVTKNIGSYLDSLYPYGVPDKNK